jgi:phospholipase C
MAVSCKRWVAAAAVVVVTAGLVTSCQSPDSKGRRASDVTREQSSAVGIHKIQHVIVIMQENRSFDSYFGTYPGADGIPADVTAGVIVFGAFR